MVIYYLCQNLNKVINNRRKGNKELDIKEFRLSQNQSNLFILVFEYEV